MINENGIQFGYDILGPMATEEMAESLMEYLEGNHYVEMDVNGNYAYLNEDEANKNWVEWMCKWAETEEGKNLLLKNNLGGM